MMDILIVFTRIPCEGKNKTRLIPALGAAGATAFHDRLARHTIARARSFTTSRTEISLRIYITGGTPDEAQTWLGQGDYRDQSSGDLGQRLQAAINEAFADAASRVVVIGTDCPELDETILGAAFDSLAQNAITLGPAHDGGYYLIGLTEPCPAVFSNIEWSTSIVFEQTLQAAKSAGKKVHLLPPLADCDLPEDLPAAETSLAQQSDH